MKYLSLIILCGLVLFIYFCYKNTDEYFSSYGDDGNLSLSEYCIKECPFDISKCQEICDTWVFYLSSGGRLGCPPFISQEMCDKAMKF